MKWLLGLILASLLLPSLPLSSAVLAQEEPVAGSESSETTEPASEGVEPDAAEPAESPQESPSPDASPEEPAPAEPPADTPVDPTPAPGGDEPKAPENTEAAPAAAAADFAQAFEQWKELLREMRELQVKYQLAAEEELAELQSQWAALVERGNLVLLPQLRETGLAAFRESPNSDRQLTRFLVKLVEDGNSRDDYEPALALAEDLLAAGCEVKDLTNLAGIAAFCTNHFERAEQLLRQAETEGVLQGRGVEFLAQAEKYQELWEKEKALREAEADDDLPRVRLETTAGVLMLELFENEAPETVGNFVSLVEKGYYDDLTFHRVIQGFMAQGGCPNGDGRGGPGYQIYCESDRPDHRLHFRGSLSMAHAGKDTGGSQFFLCFAPAGNLDGKHTVFGRVIEGFDALPRIERGEPVANPTKIVKAEVVRKRDHEYQPNKVE